MLNSRCSINRLNLLEISYLTLWRFGRRPQRHSPHSFPQRQVWTRSSSPSLWRCQAWLEPGRSLEEPRERRSRSVCCHWVQELSRHSWSVESVEKRQGSIYWKLTKTDRAVYFYITVSLTNDETQQVIAQVHFWNFPPQPERGKCAERKRSSSRANPTLRKSWLGGGGCASAMKHCHIFACHWNKRHLLMIADGSNRMNAEV